MNNILFITNGGGTTGFGHIMRCLSLANSFRDRGHKVSFLSELAEGIQKIRSSNFELIDRLESLESLKLDLIVVDKYDVSNDYFNELRRHTRLLMYIDDINAFQYDVDIVLNGNLSGKYIGYDLSLESTEFLLGPKYNLIRDEFKDMPSKVTKKAVKNIMITTGGADPYGLALKLLQYIKSYESLDPIEIDVIIGGSFEKSYVESLEAYAKGFYNIRLNKGVSRMSEIMVRSDIAISSCGSTLYELCACGTPTIGFIIADNQEFLAEKMEEFKYIELLGWYNDINRDLFIDKLLSLIADVKKRKEISNRQQNLVDGLGVERVVRRIENILKKRGVGIEKGNSLWKAVYRSD